MGLLSRFAKQAEILHNMKRAEFLGEPKIVSANTNSQLRPKALKHLGAEPAEPFMDGKFQMRLDADGAAVYDGDKVIASYNWGDTLAVDPAYRGQDIAKELVYQWRSRFPAPAAAKTRTNASQAIAESVWERISRELGENPNRAVLFGAAPAGGLLSRWGQQQGTSN